MSLLRVLLFLIIFSSGNIYGQDFLQIDSRDFTSNKVQGKKLKKNIRKARKLFDKGDTSSSECLDLLLECYDFNQENAELNYNIGLVYLLYGQKEMAKPFLEQVKNKKPNLNTDLYLLLGQACQYGGDFSDAILNYKTYIEILQQKRTKHTNQKFTSVLNSIEECKNAQTLSIIKTNCRIEILPEPINSKFTDKLVFRDGSKLYFTSDRILLNNKKKNRASIDLRGFSVELINGKWANYSTLSDPNGDTDLPMMVAKVDKNQYVFSTIKSGKEDLIFMQKSKRNWTKEMDVFFMNEENSNESSASFSEDASVAVFISDRDGNQNDIFYCKKNNDGEWSKPIKMNRNVNTDRDERDAYLSKNGRTVYFSSKGHNSIGGYDIFKSEMDTNGNWSKAVNMGLPINSPYDDCHFIADENDSFMFDSNRGGNGKFDIYTNKIVMDRFTEDEKEKPIEPIAKLDVSIPVEKIDVLPEVIPIPKSIVKKVEIILTTYRIQIAASKIKLTSTKLKKIYRGAEVVSGSYDGVWYRYTIGDYSDLSDAIYYRDRLGVAKAFVVRYENDIRKGMMLF